MNTYFVEIRVTTPDGRVVVSGVALDPREVSCLEPLPDFPDNPAAAFAAGAQIEARRNLAQRLAQVAAGHACDVIEAIHAGIEPSRDGIERAKAEAKLNPLFARFGVGRY